MAGLPPFAKVNVLYWYKEIDDVAYTLAHHLRGLAYEPHLYRYDEEAPLADAPLLFTYAMGAYPARGCPGRSTRSCSPALLDSLEHGGLSRHSPVWCGHTTSR